LTVRIFAGNRMDDLDRIFDRASGGSYSYPPFKGDPWYKKYKGFFVIFLLLVAGFGARAIIARRV